MRPWTPFLLLLAGCVSTSQPIPVSWLSVPRATRINALQLDPDGKVTTMPGVPKDNGPIRVEGNRLFNGQQPITDSFAAIDSFDYHAARGEVVFSARRDKSFDIGLVASDGSVTNWIPPEPGDEIAVKWAPRGNKVSYIVRGPFGDVVRTFHVPTSFQYAMDFGTATIHELAWDPPAERYAVAYSTLDASDRIEVLHYDGRDRRIALPPSASVAADVVPFGAGAFALRPFDMPYGEKLPVVLWVADRFDWSDERAALLKNARVAVIVAAKIDGELWRLLRDTTWLDSSRIYVVEPQASSPVDKEAAPDGALIIVPDATLASGHYRQDGNRVAVAPAAIQSFAAGFIADHLKRTSATNGSSG